MDERASSYQEGNAGMSGKRGSDATLQNENIEKVDEPKDVDEPRAEEGEPKPTVSHESVPGNSNESV
jgi:hypothetical protein